MKSWAWAAVGLLIGGGMMGGAACGNGGSGTGGSGTGGGSGGSSSTVNPQTSSSTGAGMGGGMSCGALVPSGLMPAACGTCVAGACCDEAKKCDPSGGTPCGMLLGCIIQAAGDPTAITTCETQTPSGAADLAAFEACVGASKCVGGTSPACPPPASLCFTNTIGYNDMVMDPNQKALIDECDQCLGNSCCPEFSKLTEDTANDPACASGSCVELTDLQTCLEDPTGCMGGADSKAAAQCQDMKCGATCGVPICDSGIQNGGTSAFTCSSCLDTNCCMEFEASTCNASNPPPASCTTWLNDFNMCAMDNGMCNGDASAQAAFTCQTTNCMSECM